MSDKIRTVIINFQTPDLLKVAVETFRKFYPQTKLTIIDNGSKDDSRDFIKEIQSGAPQFIDVLLIEKNIYQINI